MRYPKETGRLLDRTTGDYRFTFTVDSPQKIRDAWRNTDRIMRYYGPCTVCGIRTYAFDDGDNDPRGMLGDHAADPFTLSEHVSQQEADAIKAADADVTLPACFCCTNEYDCYQYLTETATRKARKAGADI